jgi:hypothetical protein
MIEVEEMCPMQSELVLRCTPTNGRDKTTERPRNSPSRVQSVAGECPPVPPSPLTPPRLKLKVLSPPVPCAYSPPPVRSRVPLPVLLEARVCRDMSRRSVHPPAPPHAHPPTGALTSGKGSRSVRPRPQPPAHPPPGSSSQTPSSSMRK